jgi:hypothetical protein
MSTRLACTRRVVVCDAACHSGNARDIRVGNQSRGSRERRQTTLGARSQKRRCDGNYPGEDSIDQPPKQRCSCHVCLDASIFVDASVCVGTSIFVNTSVCVGASVQKITVTASFPCKHACQANFESQQNGTGRSLHHCSKRWRWYRRRPFHKSTCACPRTNALGCRCRDTESCTP